MFTLLVFGVVAVLLGIIIILIAVFGAVVGLIGSMMSVISTLAIAAFVVYLGWRVIESILNRKR